MSHVFDLRTDANGDQIVQELSERFGQVREVIFRRVLVLSEQQIRDKLIELGWTPPLSADESLAEKAAMFDWLIGQAPGHLAAIAWRYRSACGTSDPVDAIKLAMRESLQYGDAGQGRSDGQG